MKERQLGSTAYPTCFLLVSSGDHVTPVTGITPTVTISKNGGFFAAIAVPTGSVTEIGNGWYALAGNAADRDTLGTLIIHATGTGADPTDSLFTIVPWDPFALKYDTSGYAKVSSGTGTGQVSLTSGAVTVGSYASSQDPATLVLNATATSYNTTGSIGAKINTAGSGSGSSLTASQVATAVWQDTTVGDFAVSGSAGALLTAINTQSAKLNFSTVNSVTMVKADTQAVAGQVSSTADGTAQAITTNTLTLALPTSDPRTANNLANWTIEIISATSGAGQTALITSYNASTQVATVTSWPNGTPTGTVTYNLYRPVVTASNLDKTGYSLGAGAITSTTFGSGAIDSNAFAQTAGDKVWNTTSRSITDKAGFALASGAITSTTFGSGAIDSNAFAQTAGDKVWNTTSRSITDKAGFALSSTGLDSISVVAPSGKPANFREMLIMVYRRYFSPIAKIASNTTSGTITTYADNGQTAITTQQYTDDGSGNQTQGGA